MKKIHTSVQSSMKRLVKSKSSLNKTADNISFKQKDKMSMKKQKILKPNVLTKNDEKQNIEFNSIRSSDQKAKGKSYKPMLKKNSKLGLTHNTVSLVINESTIQTKKENTLDSLLYGDVDLSYSRDFTLKNDQNDQLLIDNCGDELNFKSYKNLSPIKSISQYSITNYQKAIFMAEKIDTDYFNLLLILKKPQKEIKIYQNSNIILLQRMMILFKEHPEKLFHFYYKIVNSHSKDELQNKIRQYLFENSVIFNKLQLNQFITLIQEFMNQLFDKQHFGNQYCEVVFEQLIQKLFLKVENYENTTKVWMDEFILQKAFENEKNTSIWKLAFQLLSQTQKESVNQFSHSRFCNKSLVDCSQFISESNQKKKQQSINTLAQWISNYLRPIMQMAPKTKSEEQKMFIKITPPLIH